MHQQALPGQVLVRVLLLLCQTSLGSQLWGLLRMQW
jgi:hypothetical protein